jgi:N-methylhydantoinase B
MSAADRGVTQGVSGEAGGALTVGARHTTPITLELLRNGLAAIADEMAITEVRAAYSTVIRDLLDFSTAVCDEQGRMLAQGLTLAIQLGGIPRFMRHLMEQVKAPRPGDVYLANDPWQGGLHLPDFFFARPVFAEGEHERPIAWTASVSHMVDVGGRFPGGISVTAASLWEEGLILPIVPLVQAGQLNQAVLDIIAANVRDPAKVHGDIRAALAALETGARQMVELAERLGADELRAQLVAFLDHSERSTRAALREIPDGRAEARGFLDDDGVGGAPVEIRCLVEKLDETLSFDFTGTAAEVPSGINCTIADVMSVCSFVAGASIGEDARVDDGFTRCIEFTIPDGTVASARRPAAVSARGTLIYRLTDVAVAAMAQLTPARLPAEGGGPALVTFSGTRPDGTPWICLDFVQAGWGATGTHDGVPAASHAISNTGNIPIESIEQDFPLRVTAYELLPDTGGTGMFSGAAAVAREYEVLADNVAVNYRVERQAFAPEGAHGGGPGSPARCRIRRATGSWADVPAKAATMLNQGDRLRVELPGGAGFGDPAERRADAVAAAIAGGLLSSARAQEDYR